MDQLSISLDGASDVAELLADKNPGDKVEILVLVTIAEKDDKRFVSDIDEVLEVDGETLAEESADATETAKSDEEDAPVAFGKKKKPTFGDEADA